MLRLCLFTCPAMSHSPFLDGYNTDRDRTTPALSSGRSRPSATSEASHGDRCSAPSLAMVMEAITELRNDVEKLKKDRPAVSTEDCQFMGSVSGPHSNMGSVSQDSPAGFSGFRAPVSEDSDEGEEFQGAI